MRTREVSDRTSLSGRIMGVRYIERDLREDDGNRQQASTGNVLGQHSEALVELTLAGVGHTRRMNIPITNPTTLTMSLT